MGASGEREGPLPGREEETSGTTTRFEHAVPCRAEASHCALLGVRVIGTGVGEHCTLILSTLMTLSRSDSKGGHGRYTYAGSASPLSSVASPASRLKRSSRSRWAPYEGQRFCPSWRVCDAAFQVCDGPQRTAAPFLRSVCGPACREQPGTDENDAPRASAFSRVFPRVPGCLGGRLGDNRDWDAIDAWAREIAHALETTSVRAVPAKLS